MQIKDFQNNVTLAPYTTYKIGGPAKYFFTAKSTEEILQAIKVANENNLKYFILGKGSNVLFSDDEFNGLVIKVEAQYLAPLQNFTCPTDRRAPVQKSKIKSSYFDAEAGVLLADLVAMTGEMGLTGLEWAVGIPGTIGGAVRGNTGAFRQSISSVVKNVNYWDGSEVKNIIGQDCRFSYRHSIFKENLAWVILSVTLELQKSSQEKVKQTMAEIQQKRGNFDLVKNPCAGCVFKNGDYKNLAKKAKKKFPEIEKFAVSGVIPAGWLIDQLDLKGKKIGGAQIWEEHANFIINTGNATAKDVVMLISLIKQKIRDNFGIQLQEEIQYLGF